MRRALPIVLLMAACSGAPTQPANATANVVYDAGGGGGINLVISVCASGTCSMSGGRLRNIGAGCATGINVTVTIDGVIVITSPVTVAGSVTRPNETVPFSLDNIPNVGWSNIKFGATWEDIPCR